MTAVKVLAWIAGMAILLVFLPIVVLADVLKLVAAGGIALANQLSKVVAS